MNTLECEGISFRYGKARVLADLDLSVGPGEFVAITGPSGCGKSTLLFVLGLLLRPDEGTVTVSGMPTSTLTDAQRSELRGREIGFIFQDTILDEGLSVLDNVMLSELFANSHPKTRHSPDRARQALQSCGIAELADRRPRRLSGGQAQRVGVARALVKQPSLVLADEPTGNLDPTNTEVIVSQLRRAATNGAAVVVVTHDPSVARLSDRTVELTSA